MQNETLGEYILHGRTGCGLTREALAARLRVTARDVGEWERNVSVPGRLARLRLSRVLGLPYRELTRRVPWMGGAEGLFGRRWDLLLSILPLLAGICFTVLAMMGKADLFTGAVMLIVGIVCIVINIRRRR